MGKSCLNLKTRKPYKAKSPTDTVNKIRNILHENGLFTIENKHFGLDNSIDTFSCRIILANDKFYHLDIGTNGKGRTIEYSLASGYGEFMERLQTDELFPSFLFYLQRKYHLYNEKVDLPDTDILEFCYAPDEKIDYFNQVENNIPSNVIALLKAIERKNNQSLYSILKSDNPKTVLAPFYSVTEEKTVNLPFDIVRAIAATNGTCAGNTPEEALIQGLCEIFERYACKKIFFESLECPDISEEVFAETNALDLLNKIRDYGNYTIKIKDCSCGTGLPVIGILIVNRDEYKYIFRLGADPCPEIALERCLTELYQGIENIDNHFLPIEKAFNSQQSDFTKTDIFKENYIKFVISGRGCIPKSFLNNYLENSFDSYQPDPGFGINNKTDLHKIIQIIESMGYQIYIRDCSYLGFPTYYIFIPGLSDMFGQFNPLPHETDRLYDTLNNLKNSADKKLKKTSEYLEGITGTEVELEMHYKMFLPPLIEHDLGQMDNNLFLAMLNYKLENYFSSYQWFDKFLKDEANKFIANKEYYFCVRDYIRLKQKSDNNEIKRFLLNSYSQETIDDVLQDMADPQDIFKYYSVSTCFNCSCCELIDSCLLKTLYKSFKNLKTNQQQNKIVNQKSLKKFFI